ncbi:hypothetical protein C0J52_14809 [Blattella germanica]|nr:hypothetical protein C0J52_14809 [Blattella germanica]
MADKLSVFEMAPREEKVDIIDYHKREKCNARKLSEVIKIGIAEAQILFSHHLTRRGASRMAPNRMKKCRQKLKEDPINRPIVLDKKLKRAGDLSEETANLIREFYCMDSIGRLTPGRKDAKSIKDPRTGKRQLIQKRYLVMTILEAFDLFILRYIYRNPNFINHVLNMYSCAPKTPQNVTVLTIGGCFLKAGFPTTTDDCEMASEISDKMQVSQELISAAGFTFDASTYMNIDSEIPTECDSQDTAVILQSVQEGNSEDRDEEEDDKEEENKDTVKVVMINVTDVSPISSYSEVLDIVKRLRAFYREKRDEGGLSLTQDLIVHNEDISGGRRPIKYAWGVAQTCNLKEKPPMEDIIAKPKCTKQTSIRDVFRVNGVCYDFVAPLT